MIDEAASLQQVYMEARMSASGSRRVAAATQQSLSNISSHVEIPQPWETRGGRTQSHNVPSSQTGAHPRFAASMNHPWEPTPLIHGNIESSSEASSQNLLGGQQFLLRTDHGGSSNVDTRYPQVQPPVGGIPGSNVADDSLEGREPARKSSEDEKGGDCTQT